MVQINVAHTTKINPEGATPILTHSQVWNALQRKIRAPQEFVPVMESCEVLEDKDGVVKRRVVFRKGVTPWDEVVEVATSFWPDWIDFHQDTGLHIRNLISRGPTTSPTDLNLTYTFEHSVPNASADADEKVEQFRAMAKSAVEQGVEVIRAMVKDGRIK